MPVSLLHGGKPRGGVGAATHTTYQQQTKSIERWKRLHLKIYK